MNYIRKILYKLRGSMNIDTLIKRGLIIGENVFINFGCIFDESFCWLIEIGNNVTFAPNVHVIAHDASTKRELDLTKIGEVIIGNNVFVGAGTIILPNTKIGDNVIIGAGSVVTGNIESNCLVAGNPAKIIDTYDNYMKKQKQRIELSKVYDKSFTINGGITEDMKQQMKKDLHDSNWGGYVV